MSVHEIIKHFFDLVLYNPFVNNQKHLFQMKPAKVYLEHQSIQLFESNIHLICNLFLELQFSFVDSIDRFQ